MTSNPDELLGRTIGPYLLERLLGQGGFAWVYRATRSADQYAAAVKVLKPRYSGDPQFDRRFRDEADVAAKLTHPHIVRILDVGHADGFTYFAMDLFPESLASLLARSGPLPENMALRIAADVTRGLAFAHEAGLVHRDIKVDNVFLKEDGTAIIGDFGIARAVSGYGTATGVDMTIGTPQYISPEQAQGRPVDGRSDLYSLGVMLYRSVTGEAPFHSTDWFELARMHVEDRPTPPRQKRPELSQRFERVILKCLAKHPNDRYASAQVLLTELEALHSEARSTDSFGMGAPMLGEVREGPRRSGWPRWALAVLVVVLVAVLVVVLGQ